jgi:hypothetical protein
MSPIIHRNGCLKVNLAAQRSRQAAACGILTNAALNASGV